MIENEPVAPIEFPTVDAFSSPQQLDRAFQLVLDRLDSVCHAFLRDNMPPFSGRLQQQTDNPILRQINDGVTVFAVPPLIMKESEDISQREPADGSKIAA